VYRPSVEKIDVPHDQPLTAWAGRYPDAANQLADWMHHYPRAAAKLSEWGVSHPVQMSTLVGWAVTHKFEALDAFLYDRAGWGDFDAIRKADRDGVTELVEWMRRSPSAAEELAVHASGIAWAREHVHARRGHHTSAPHSAVSQERTLGAHANP
jgi:hypothetical protein